MAKTKGRDVAAPTRSVVWNGVEYRMVFSNQTARIVEDVYEQRYGRPDMGYYDALNELSAPKHRALMAFAYAAIVAGGGEVAWDDFDEGFTLDAFAGLTDMIREAVIESLPEDDGKNPEAAPAEG